jgi:hypothetical protein
MVEYVPSMLKALVSILSTKRQGMYLPLLFKRRSVMPFFHQGYHTFTQPGVQELLCICRNSTDEYFASILENTQIGISERMGAGGSRL